MPNSPDFSKVAKEYASYRPGYPPELFDWLAATVKKRNRAWDVATGSGQAALGLVDHFDQIIATDVSAAQLRHATPHPNIDYRVASAETSGLPDGSVDLVVVAAAIHWFNLPQFYEEVRRVMRPGGVVAAWTYHVAYVSPPLDDILLPFYREVVSAYFPEGARLVDARYEGIVLPGEPLNPPSFHASVRWSATQVLQFIRTWSGVQAYIAAMKRDPVIDLEASIVDAFGGADTVVEIQWPLYLRAARL
jgi:ubiquinone/menaquinone biosynthesis C-methylase UbiE